MRNKLPQNYINVADLKQLGVKGLQLDDSSMQESENSFHQSNIPFVLISGSYKDDENNDYLCSLFGNYLSRLNVGIVSGGGKSGLMVSHSFSENVIETNNYDPNKIILCRRRKGKTQKIEVDTIGSVKFFEGSAVEMRQAMISSVSAVVVIGGKTVTREEEYLARIKNIPVIPIARTGGTALEIWEEYKRNPDDQSLSVQQFDALTFNALNSKHINFAVDAAISLLKTSVKLLTLFSYGILVNLS